MPEPDEVLTQLPRLPSETEVIEKLCRWAREFDELDEERYTAADFLEWVELEHLPRPRNKEPESPGRQWVPVWSEAALAAIS